MASVDLGKQIGPLPLGAWVAVVAGGLGIAVYTRRQNAAPIEVEDTSGVPGVGEGGSGLWTDITPQPPQATGPTVYTDNDSWGKAAIDRLIAEGYNPAQVYSAVTKALAGGTGDNKLSVQEYSVWSRALTLLKTPPTPIGVPAPTAPTSPTTPAPTPARYKMQWTSSRVEIGGETIKTKQTRFAKEAANSGVWRPSAASLNSVILQAATRSGVRTTTILPRGRWIVVYRMVRA